MPFTSETASVAGSKGGVNRWKDKDPKTIRNRSMRLAVTQDEFQTIAAKATAMSLSKTELVIRAVMVYEREETK